MSKKKNTLKDLDEFLKQQAATLVSPERLSDKVETTTPPPAVEKEIAAPPVQETAIASAKEHVSADGILRDLLQLSSAEGHHFRKKFYDLIIQLLEQQNQSLPEDKMLINTTLYLKSGDQWKEAIRNYWRSKAKV
ncbi:MAG: hypothetical protein ACOYXT_18195 [Bacteroidota bacterium]